MFVLHDSLRFAYFDLLELCWLPIGGLPPRATRLLISQPLAPIRFMDSVSPASQSELPYRFIAVAQGVLF